MVTYLGIMPGSVHAVLINNKLVTDIKTIDTIKWATTCTDTQKYYNDYLNNGMMSYLIGILVDEEYERRIYQHKCYAHKEGLWSVESYEMTKSYPKKKKPLRQGLLLPLHISFIKLWNKPLSLSIFSSLNGVLGFWKRHK